MLSSHDTPPTQKFFAIIYFSKASNYESEDENLGRVERVKGKAKHVLEKGDLKKRRFFVKPCDTVCGPKSK